MASAQKDKSLEKALSPDQSSSPGQNAKSSAVTCLAEAEEYVDSIMSTQRISKVDTPNVSTRKRHLSVSGTSDTTSKKARNGDNYGDCDETEEISKVIEDLTESKRPPVKARRNLYKKGGTKSTKSPHKVVVTEADVHVNGSPTMEQLFAKMSSDMNMMFMSVNERLVKLDSGLEQRIANKVAQLLDKRVNTELNRVRKDIDSRLDDFKSSIKADLAADLDDIRDEISTRVSTTPNIPQQKDLSLNIVIRNLPESHNENAKSKVNAIFRDGLKLSDISVEDAERKQSHSESKPGVIVARMNSKQDKQRVMKEKSRLKDSRQFSKVYINHDQHPSERSVSTNFRKILHAMKSNKNNLMMKGSRVVYDDGNSNSSKPDDSDSYHHRQSASRGSLNNGQNPRERSDRTDGDRSGSHVVNRSYSGGWRKVNRGASRHDSRPNSRDARAQGNYRWRD